METEKTAIDILSSDSMLFELEEQFKQQGTQYRWSVFDSDTCYLVASVKAGRKTRDVVISEDEAAKYLGFNFTHYRALGDLDAFECMEDSGPCVEVALVGLGYSAARHFQRIPGWQMDEESETVANGWVVRFQGIRDERWSAEIGSASKEFKLLTSGYGYAPTLRLRRSQSGGHDEALEFLESVGGSVLFELDMNHGMSLTMRRARFSGTRRIRRRPVRNESPPTLPRLRYSKDPLSLYNYARSAVGMPLLQFLAYYQVLEYYFPRYSQRDLLDRLRNELRDPRFRPDDDLHLSRILRISQHSGRGYGDERSQLKATVRYSVSGDSIAEFIESDAGLLENFSQKKPLIPGLSPVDVKKRSDLVNSVCERIYHIRCLVVHSKEDGGGNMEKLLLPFSKEADDVRTENELMQFLAQKVLIAGAEPLPV
ncbi:hypothetical protein [Streptomyces sp. NPDC023327]|uniref:hypothetical protein n=1 Tax=Streptomyces sp. NPDC023327 TaxID=3157088 RepID=UPI00340DBA90